MTTTVNTGTPDYISGGVLTDTESWVALNTTILTGDANSITWQSSTGANNWSQYMDLVIISYAHNDYSGSSTNYTVYAQFNNDTTTANYEFNRFYGSGTSATGQYLGSPSGMLVGGSISDAFANYFNASIARIYDINSGKWKVGTCQTAGCAASATYNTTSLIGSVWKGDESSATLGGGGEAITEIDLITGDNWTVNSRFDLFGVLPRMVTA